MLLATAAPLIIVARIKDHFSQAERDRPRAEASKFEGLISAARGYSTQLSNRQLIYPLHSIVAYSFGRDRSGAVDWAGEKKPGEGIPEDASLRHFSGVYHYACPHEWLATTKEEVKLVVLVSEGSYKEIGHYERGAGPAYQSTWDVEFADVASQHIVSKAHIIESDHDIGPLSLFDSNSSTVPTDSEVISAIQGAVSFVR